MKSLRLLIAAGALVATPATVHSSPLMNRTAAHDFDFLVGEWRVHHRRIQAGTHQWVEFDGTCGNWALMSGAANVEEHWLNTPNGAYRAVGLRSYDPKRDEWSIRWLDGRYPAGTLDPPVVGRFENGVGSFYNDYTQDGKPMRARYQWSRITPTSARWEQATSADGGKTWDTNWIMEFKRVAATPAGLSAVDTNVTGGVHDFDFLRGDWQVHHRYVRASGEWVDVSGTCRNGLLMQGWANLEEHSFDMPGGRTQAVALRAFDPKTGQWSVWWLDGRDPAADFDPPVQGHFEGGVGTFFGETKVAGKPVRQRFIWSQITPTSARWEQAYSSDSGRTWETNWVMQFQRDQPKTS